MSATTKKPETSGFFIDTPHKLLLTLLLFGMQCLAWAHCFAADSHIAVLKKSHPGIKWDPASGVTTELNGDNRKDFAVLGYRSQQVILAIFASNKPDSSPQLFTFGISPNIQDGICELPAVLEPEELSCQAEDVTLSGCKESKKVKGLLLYGGECDAIHLYWNHERKRMDWWRL